MDTLLSMRRKKIGAIIRKERKKKFKSQAAFAASIREELNLQPKEITQGTVSNWENGRCFPSLDYLLAMSRIFNCDCGYLLGDYDEHTRDSEESVNIDWSKGDPLAPLFGFNFTPDWWLEHKRLFPY